MFQKALYPHRFCRRRQILRVSKLTLFFCLLALTSSYARPFGKPSFPGIKIKGTVTSNFTKQSIPNATVSATDAKGNILTATKTNTQGYYQVSVLSGSVKTIFVRIEVTGYQSQYKGGALSPYRTYTIDFSLTPIKPSPPPKIDKIPPIGHITINKNQRFTNSPQVTLSLLARDDRGGSGLSQMCFSNVKANDNQAWSTPEAYTITKAWTLSSGDGPKALYAKFSDKAGNWSQVYSSAITLDTIAPVTSDLGIDGLWHNSPVTITLTSQDPALASELDSNTKLLLRLDGEDGSSTFKDEAGKAITPYGNARIDTAQSKFGTASLLLDGDSDYVTLPDSADWTFGTGDFTIDFWMKINSGYSGSQGMFGQFEDGNNQWILRLDNGGITFYWYIAGAYKANYSASAGVIPNDGAWHHIAVVRNSTVGLAFVDGVSQTFTASTAFGANDLTDVVAVLKVGGAGNNFLNGWIDELRISKGIARWTSNFTLPTAYSSGVSRTYCSTDGSTPTIPYTNPFTLTDDGEYTIKYYSIDKAGNLEAVKTATDKVRIDKAPPEASIIINNQNQTSESWDVSLSLLADDTLSGMGQGAQMQFSNDNSNWSSPEDYSSVKPWKLSSGFGTKTVYVKFKDTAGNWSEDVSDTIEVVSIPKERIYIYLNGKRVAMEENGKKYFFHPDHLGSTNVITDESGAQVKYIEYKPYGETKLEEGSLNTHRKFTGKELDDSTGLYDYGARQYDAKLGRFISADTINPDLTNPQSLNRYSYALNNPLKYIDPSGHAVELVAALAIPGVREAIVIGGYLVLKWSFEQLSRSIHSMPYINLSFRLPGFDRSASPPPAVESPSMADIKYKPEGISYVDMPNTGVMISSGSPKTGHRYVGDKEAKFAKEKGYVPNVDITGKPKEIFYTPETSLRSARTAKEKYNLGNKPTYRVDLDISKTRTDYGGNVVDGKGIEMTTRENIPTKGVERLNP